MKLNGYFAIVAFTLAILLLGTKVVGAQLQLQQSYGEGGGMISGSVYGFNMYDELEPIDWASVHAQNSQYSFVSYTGGGGYYEMYVPAGTYNVTVVQPGYLAYSNAVAVAPGSASTINFYLEQSHVPVPEFPTGIATGLMVLSLASVLVAVRRTKRKR